MASAGAQDAGADGFRAFAAAFADGRDWIEAAGANDYEHDAVGNIKTRTGPSVPGGSQTIDYTTLDLPSRITGTSGVTEFAYDSAGRRAVKQTPTSTTFYQGGVYQRTETESATDNRFTIYAAGRAIAEVSTADTGAPAVTYLHADVLGSIQSVSTSAGALATTRHYGPFGAAQSAPPGQPVTPYGFTGHEGDDELGLINMKGRMYDPTLGQFLSADPIIQQPFSQGLNRFAYVNNSPLNFTDPSGFECRGKGGRGCSASAGSAFTQFGSVAGFVGGAVAIGAVAHLGAGPTAIGGGGAPRGGGDGAAQGLASLGPEGSGATQPGVGLGNLLAPVDAAVWNNEMFGNSKPPTVSTMKPAGNANVGSNGGTPGRGAVSKDSAAPVQEGKPPAAIPKQLADRSRFAGAEYAILRKLKGPGGPDRAGALDIANRFWDAPDRGIYDHTVEGYAVTNRDRGSGALAISYGTKTFQSPRSLISTVYHESVIHGGQSRAGNYARQHTKGDAINEIEAYDAELRLAPLTGISSDEIDELTGLRQEYYDELFGTSLRGQVDSGDFTVPEGDLAP